MIHFYQSSGGGGGRKFPFGNPLANALVVLVGTLAVSAFVLLGFIAFIVVGSLVVILAAVIGIRVWWFNRRFSRAQAGERLHRRDVGDNSTRIIEGEFHDISTTRDGDDGESRP